MQDIDESTLVVRNDSIPTGEVDGELVALDLDKGHCFGMDNVGAAIWAIAAEPVSVGTIVDRLTSSHAVERAQCLADVLPFIGELVTEGLLRRQPE
jgi:hypothetical protein